MNGPGREEKTMAQLIRIAKVRADDLQSHLTNLETASASAEASLDWLAKAVRTEENARSAAASVVDLARYLEGAARKRKALEATRDRLAAEAVLVRELLRDAYGELKKFEHLIDINRRAVAKRTQKSDEAAAGDLAITRAARRGLA